MRDAAFFTKKAADFGVRGVISFLVHQDQAAVPVSTTTSTSTLTKPATALSNGLVTDTFSSNKIEPILYEKISLSRKFYRLLERAHTGNAVILQSALFVRYVLDLIICSGL